MPAATTLDVETAARLRTAIGRLSRRLRTTASTREAGLTPTGISLLLNVARRDTVRISDLAEDEGVNPTMLSRVITGLVDAGLVERVSDLSDRRSVWITITRKGLRLAERMRTERTRAVNSAMEELSAEDQRRIQSALPALEALAEGLRESRP